MKYCHKCGTRLSDTDQFCSNCGTPIKRSTKNKSFNNGLAGKRFWSLLLVVVIVIIAVFALLVRNKKSQLSVPNHSSQSSKMTSNNNKVSSSESSDSQNPTNSSSSTTSVSNKTVGVFLWLLKYPDSFKEGVKNGLYDYGTTSAGYNYVSTGGDPTSWIHYKVDGDTVTYKYVDDSNGETVAEAPTITATISLAQLEKDYYVNQSQKDEVNGYVSELTSGKYETD